MPNQDEAVPSGSSVFQDLTDQVVERMRNASSDRLREVLGRLVHHLHAFVREVGLTQEEWRTGVDFLTRTGQICDTQRQEFILLSDILGVSMLVDAVNHPEAPGLADSTVLGPFYSGRQRELAFGESILLRPEPGEPLWMDGRIIDGAAQPVADAVIEVWQTAPNELYDVQDPDQPRGHLRATLRSDAQGAYGFQTILPTSYPIPDDGPAGQLLTAMGRHPYRPAHIHFLISAPGYRTLVTHLFIAGDRYLESDAVFGVKSSLIVKPEQEEGRLKVTYDFGLAPAPPGP
jgi:catechol 1,2-dioxygenase